MGLGVVAICFTATVNEVDAQKYSTARASRFTRLGGGQSQFSQSSQTRLANSRAPISRIRTASNPGPAAAPSSKSWRNLGATLCSKEFLEVAVQASRVAMILASSVTSAWKCQQRNHEQH